MQMRSKHSALLTVVTAVALSAAFARPAGAGVTALNFESGGSIEETGVTFTGTLSYDDVANLLTVSLNNTSTFQSVITGIRFNVAGDAAADYRALDDAGTPGVIESAFGDGTALSPFGTFDAGASLQNLSQQQVRGIDEGETGRFTFDVSGADADRLRAIDFFTDELGGGGLSGAFAVRYQSVGADAEGSDKAVAVLAAPLPPAAWAGLLTMGLAGLGHLRARGRRHAA